MGLRSAKKRQSDESFCMCTKTDESGGKKKTMLELGDINLYEMKYQASAFSRGFKRQERKFCKMHFTLYVSRVQNTPEVFSIGLREKFSSQVLSPVARASV